MEFALENWTQKDTYTDDQRRFRLPPTWISRKPERGGQVEQGNEVLESGPRGELKKRITALLASAREKVVVSSFLLADSDVEDAIIEAAKKRVRVYVLLASEARLDSEPGDGEFEQRVLSAHKDMLSRLGGYVLIRSAPHFHAKLVLVDPETSPAGMLLTANLTKEALGRNEELAVVLKTYEVKEAAEIVRWALWENAEHEFVDPPNFRAVKPLGCVAHPAPAPHVLATTSSVTQLREETNNIIDSAFEKLIVASFGWDAKHPVVERLCERVREGLAVTVLARVRERAMPALVALAEAGAQVLGFKWLHAKALWADTGRALIMSTNLEKHGLDDGFEMGQRLEGKRAQELRTRLEQWSNRAAWKLYTKPALGDMDGDVRVWHEKKLFDLDVKPRISIDLGKVTAASALDMKAPPLDPPPSNVLPKPAHEIEYRRLVQAPVLHPKAKKVTRTGIKQKDVSDSNKDSPPVYEEPDGRLVVAVRSQEEISDARQVAKEVGAAAVVVRMVSPSQ